MARLAGSVAVVVTDIVMQGLDGHALAERIRSHSHPAPILFISGYGQEGLWLPGPVLPKPFQLDALVAEVRRLIAARETDRMAS